ncbi:MAG: hypothetical protein JW797_05495 [Bradymonadales bacterium]|nr:hypothetical protein [Bradymonadales bacterium]
MNTQRLCPAGRAIRILAMAAIGWLGWPGPLGWAQTPGMVMEQAGIHFLTPPGFELTHLQISSELGPAELIVLEPQEGTYQGQRNSGLIVLTVYPEEVQPAQAVQQLVTQLSQTFPDRDGPSVTPQQVEIGGNPCEGVRLDFFLADVALVGNLAATSLEERTVLAYYQGRSEELEVLSEVIRSVLASVGSGPPSPPPAPPD